MAAAYADAGTTPDSCSRNTGRTPCVFASCTKGMATCRNSKLHMTTSSPSRHGIDCAAMFSPCVVLSTRATLRRSTPSSPATCPVASSRVPSIHRWCSDAFRCDGRVNSRANRATASSAVEGVSADAGGVKKSAVSRGRGNVLERRSSP